MLTCKDFLNELGDYLDETLDPDLRTKLHAHVSECPNCWVILDTTEKTIRIYKGIEAQQLPSDIHNRLMSAVQKKIALSHSSSRSS